MKLCAPGQARGLEYRPPWLSSFHSNQVKTPTFIHQEKLKKQIYKLIHRKQFSLSMPRIL